MDRRLLRTRSRLQQALHVKIVEKGYEETTIQDLLDHAKVGRSTFYTHFANKEQLLLSGIEDLRERLSERQRAAARARSSVRFAFSLAMIEHATQHFDLYKATFGRRSGYLLVQRLTEMLTDLVRAELPRGRTAAEQHRRELVARSVGAGMMAVLIWWLEHAPDMTPPEVDRLFRTLCLTGVDGLSRVR
jgi:AcrR family transcriptional regulator